MPASEAVDLGRRMTRWAEVSTGDCVTLGLPSLKCNCYAGATGGRHGSIAGRAVTCDWFQSWARVGVA